MLWPDGTPAHASVSVVDENEERRGLLDASRMDGDERETSADGSFEISGLGAGPFRIHARGKPVAPGGEREETDTGKEPPGWSGEREHVASGTSDLVLTLTSALEVSGRVVDELGASVSDFVVVAQRKGRTFPWSDATNTLSASFHDPSGAFSVSGFCAGAWELTVTAEGYADSESTLVDVPAVAPLEIVLLHAASVRGVVLDPRGAPIAGAKVSAVEDRPYTSWRNNDVLPSSETGAFAIDWLLPGPVTLSARAPGWAASEPLALQLAPRQVQDGLVLRLRTGGTITGEVLGPDARPEAKQFVFLESRTGDRDGARTDAQGHFEITDVPAGEYTVRADTRGGLPLAAKITLRDGESGHVLLGPSAMGSVKLHGRVTIGGKVSGEAQLEAWRDGEESNYTQHSASRCDPDGAYELVVLGPGRYGVSISSYGGDTLSWSTAIDVPEVPEFPFDIAVAIGRIRGRVTSREGAPLVDLVVRAVGTKTPGSETSSTHTDSDGRYELLVAAGSVTVIAGGIDSWHETAASWAEARSPELSVSANQQLDGIDLVLSAGGTLAGHVTRSDGGPVRRVIILRYDGTKETMLAGTEEDGSFEIRGLEPGTLLVGAFAGSVASASPVSVTIEPGKTTEVELVLAPRGAGTGPPPGGK